MKKTLISICILLAIFTIDSCKKSSNEILTNGSSLADRPIRTETVTPVDIDNWFANMPSIKPAQVFLNAAQQATINGQQVVRIPIANNAAIYFIKQGGAISVYAYRWIYNGTAAANYTGAIYAYNFQTQRFVENIYENGKLIKYVLLANNSSPLTVGSSTLKVNEAGTGLFAQIWCFLNGGTWHTADSYKGDTGGGQGNLVPGCNYDADATTYAWYYGDPDPDFWVYLTPGGGGGSVGGVASGDGGGGPDWGPPPCPPSDGGGGNVSNTKLKTNKLAPGDGDPGDGSGCPTGDPGVWTPFNPDDYTFQNNYQFYEDRIDTRGLSKCFGKIVNVAKVTYTGALYNVINSFVGNASTAIYTWKISNGSLPPTTNAGTHWSANDKAVITTLDESKFSNATDLVKLRTILHEAIHAYLAAFFKNDPLNANDTYPDLLIAYNNYISNGVTDANNPAQHDVFVSRFIDDLAASLKIYGDSKNYGFDISFYKDLAWGGLTTTHAFTSKSQTEQDRILNFLSIQQYGKDLNGDDQSSDQKGDVGGCGL